MERYRNVLICIDRPRRDESMLQYARNVVTLADSDSVHLLHVRSADNALHDDSGDTSVTIEALRSIASSHFADTEPNRCGCDIVRGEPALEILRYAYEKDIDLIVVGRHCGEISESDGDAVVARRVTRKSTCSVLVVPEDFENKAETVLVPVRDSDCSANALDAAFGIASAVRADVVTLNVYQIHGGYSRVGSSLEEHQEIIEAAAQHECEKLLNRVDTRSVSVRCVCAPDPRGKPASIILDAVAAEKADLVVIGARGRTGAAGVLLGKVTEQLILKSPVPLLAVKKKGECLGILQALLTFAGQS